MEIQIRTVVLVKDELIALLGLRISQHGATVIRVDPREAMPVMQAYSDEVQARKWFSRSLITSVDNGWIVIYNGAPLHG